MKRILLGAALLAALALAGCGTAAASASSSAPQAAAPGVSKPAAPAASSEPQSAAPAAEATALVEPLAWNIELGDTLADGTYAVDLTSESMGEAAGEGGIIFTVALYDRYRTEQVEALKPGDVLRTTGPDGQPLDITVERVEFGSGNGWIGINGGIEEGGVDLWAEPDCYHTVEMDDRPVYYFADTYRLKLRGDAVFTDCTDNPGETVPCTVAELAERLASDTETFWAGNTCLTVEGGEVTAVERFWTP